MDKAINVSGEKYISAKRASEITKYTSDYIGQLCRAKKIGAKLIGRSWYVSKKDILKYKNSQKPSDVDFKESATVFTRDNKKTKKVTSKVFQPTALKDLGVSRPKSETIKISYIKDNAPLFPRVVKKFDHNNVKYIALKSLNESLIKPKKTSFIERFAFSSAVFSFVLLFTLGFVFEKENIGKLIPYNFGAHLKEEVSFLYGPYADEFQNSYSKFKDNILNINQGGGQLASSLFSVEGWRSASDWLKDVSYKIVEPWLQKNTSILVNENNNSSGPSLVTGGIARTVFIDGSGKEYVDLKIDELKKYFLTLPFISSTVPNVNRYYITNQNDRIVDLISSNSGSSSGGGTSNVEVLSDLDDVTLTSSTYGDVLLYNGSEWVNTATSSLGITGSGASFGQGWEINSGGYLAPTTTITTLLNGGFLSTASSTIVGDTTLSGNTYLPSLSQGFAYTGTSGKIGTIASSSIQLSWFNNDSGFLTSATSFDAFTHPSYGGSATTSLLTLSNGFLSTASSTITTDLRLSSLSVGGLAVGSGGLVYSAATTTAGTGLTYSGNAFNVGGLTTSQFTSANISQWTNDAGYTNYAFPFDAQSYGVSTSTTLGLTGGFFSTASSTLSGNTYLPSLSQGFAYTGTGGQINTIASSSIQLSWFNNDQGFITSTGTYPANSIITSNGSGALIATGTQLTVGNLLATTTATSQLWGNVGISTSTPWAQLAVNPIAGQASNQFVIGSSTATSFIVNNAGNVGIGTTSPGSLLSLGNTGANTINISATATSTFGSGINVLTGCFSINGTCLSQNSGSVTSIATNNGLTGGTITTSGTIGLNTAGFSTNALLTWDGSNLVATGTPQLTVGNLLATSTTATSQLWGNVGISTSTPWAQLAVNPIAGQASNQFVIGSSTATSFIVNNAGNVGIGTTSPGSLLSLGNTGANTINISATATSTFGSGINVLTGCFSINGTCLSQNSGSVTSIATNNGLTGGTITTSGTIGLNTAGFSTNALLTWDGSNLVATGTPQLTVGNLLATSTTATSQLWGNVGISTSTPWAQLAVNPIAGQASNQFVIGSSTATSFIVNNAGNVGIGTTSPGSLLSLGNSATNYINISATATSTFGSGINVLTGCFSINGTCLSQNSGSVTSIATNNGLTGGTITTSGTIGLNTAGFSTNALLTWDGSNLVATGTPQLTVGNLLATSTTATSQLWGNVGISTSTPWAQLAVNPIAGQASNQFVIGSSTATSFIVNNAGNVGIGTTSPGSLLSLGNSATNYINISATATSTFGSGINVLTGCFSINGTCLSQNSGSVTSIATNNGLTGGTITTSGTIGLNTAGFSTNALLTWDGSNLVATGTPQLTVGNLLATSTTATSQLWGNVGISTSTPWAQLAVNPIAGQASNQFVIGSSTATSFIVNNAGNVGIGTTSPGSLLSLGNSATNYINISATATSTFGSGINVLTGCFSINGTCLSQNSGSVTSIATNNGLTGGTITTSGTIGLNTAGFSTNALLTWDGSNLVATGTPQLTVGNLLATSTTATSQLWGNVGISTSTPWAQLAVNPIAGQASNQFVIGSSTATSFIVNNAGNVGIGTTSPGSLLSLGNTGANTINISATATSTFGSGINVLTGCFSINGTCLSQNSGSVTSIATNNGLTGGTITTSGTIGLNTAGFSTNALLTWDGSNLVATGTPQLTVGNLLATSTTATSQLWGNVGISTSTPWAQLAVNPIAGQASNQFVIGSSTATSFIVNNAGNIGIGTTSPGSLLSLGNTGANTINISATATSTFGSGINVLTGCFSINGTCLSQNSGSVTSIATNNGLTGGTITTSGTIGLNTAGFSTNALLTWDGSNLVATGTPQLTVGNLLATSTTATSQLWGNVGISTSTPWAQLAVNPIAGQASNQFVIGSSTATSFIVNNAGNIGIGTTSPGSLLSLGNSATNYINISATATSTFGSGINIKTGCFAVNGTCISAGSGTFTNTLASGGTATTTFYNGGVVFSDGSKLTQSASPQNFFWDESNKRLGLGTSSPSSILSLQPTISTADLFRVSSSTGAALFTINKYGALVLNLSSTSAVDIQDGSGNSVFTVNTATTTGAGIDITATSDQTANLLNIFASDGTTNFLTVDKVGRVGIGTSTPYYNLVVASTTAPQLSLSAGTGIAQWAFRNAGGNLYLSTTTVAGTATTTTAALSINNTSGTTTLWALNVSATGANATSTIEKNLNVKGTLKIGTASVYITEDGINVDTGSVFNIQNNGQDITIGNNSLTVSATGFGTTTLAGLNISGQATSTSNVGFNLSAGCYAISGTCLSSGGSGTVTSIATNNGLTGGTITTSGTIGLNTAGFSTNALLTWDGSNLVATGTPQLTVGNLLATSTTATSQLWGNVGISTSTPWAQLAVNPIAGQASNQFVIGSSTATSFIVNNAGNVGIGTTSPGSLLSLGNSATNYINISATATSTFGSGINVLTGCFSINGTCLSQNSGSVTSIATNNGLTGGTITTSGTIGLNTAGFSTNALLTWDGSNLVATGTPQLTVGNLLATSTTATSQLWGNVGISTSTPWAQLAVNPIAGQASNQFVIGSSTATSFIVNNAGNIGIGTTSPGSLLSLGNSATNYINISATATSTFGSGINVLTGCFSINGTCLSQNSGSVTSIATNNGLTGGTITTSGTIGLNTAGFSTNALLTWDGSNLVATGTPQLTVGNLLATSTTATSQLWGNVGISTSTPWAQLAVNPIAGQASNQFVIGSSTATSFIVNNAGNVGIGTTSPGSLLSLGNTGANTINISATATSTFGSGINVLTGCFSINGTCLSQNSGSVTSIATNNGLTGGTITTSGTIGLNTAGFSTNALLTWDGSNLVATGTPQLTVGNLLATSTTATSQLWGNVGISTSTPWAQLAVNPIAGQASNQFVIGSSTATSFIVNNAGNIGIGTTSPGSLLSLGNSATNYINISATATSTFGSGINVLTGCFSINGTCLSQNSGSVTSIATNNGLTGGTITTSGTIGLNTAGFSTNALLTWDGSNLVATGTPQLTVGNLLATSTTATSQLWGNVGISTSTPWAQLAVNPIAGQASNQFVIGSSTATSFIVNNAGNVGIGTTSPGSLLSLGNSATNYINISATATSTFGSGINVLTGCFSINGTCLSQNSGSVTSIATNNGLTGGTITTSGTIGLNTAGFSTNALLTWDGSNLVATGTPQLTVGNLLATSTTATSQLWGNVGISTSTPWAQLAVNPIAGQASNQFVIGSSTATSFIVNNAGNIGIGTTSPGSLLSLGNTGANTINISATATSTFGSGINVLTGCFAVNGTCVGGSGGSGTVTSIATNNGLTGGTITTSGTIGLNTAGFSTNALLTWDGSNLVATGTPQLTVGNLLATSTTATSQLWGNVGISTSTPWAQLAVNPIAGQASNQFVIGSSTATSFIVNNAGNIGIGTTSPGSLLSLGNTGANTINISATATSTFGSGINVLTGCFSINGTCLSQNSGSVTSIATNNGLTGGTITTSGTIGLNTAGFSTNALLTWDGSNLVATGTPQLTVGNLLATSTTATSQLWGNVGISTSTPWAQLAVNPIAGQASNQFVIGSSTATSFIVNNAGNIGIGTTSPGSLLSLGNTGANTINISATATSTFGSGINVLTGCFAVNGTCVGGSGGSGTVTSIATNNGLTGGTITTSGTIGLNTAGFSTNALLTWDGSNLVATGTPQLTVGNLLATSTTATSQLWGNVGISTSTPWAQLAVNPIAGQASNQFVIGSSTATSFIVNNAGNIGIGTTSPGSLLSLGNSATNYINISATATSTFGSGINIKTGCFAVNGTCISAGSGTFTNTLASGGTATTTFYNGGVVFSDGSKLTQSASPQNFFWDESNKRLGLGTSSPSSILSLQPTGSTNDLFRVSSSTGAALFTINRYGALVLNLSSTSAMDIQDGSGNSVFTVNTATTTGAGIDITATSDQTANLLNIFASNGTTNYMKVGPSGVLTLGTTTAGMLRTNSSGLVYVDTTGDVDGVTVTVFDDVGTTANAWSKPTGLSFTQVIVTGSGGGGGGVDANDATTNEEAAGGGGAGGTSISMIAAASLTTGQDVTIGIRGTVGAGDGTGGAGGTGGNSIFGDASLVVAVGGGPGGGADNNTDPCTITTTTIGGGGSGAATTSAVGDIKLAGGGGGGGVCLVEDPQGGVGGASYWGGGGAGGNTNGGGVDAGDNGIAYGSGGGGAAGADDSTGAVGGLGAQGVVVTMDYTSSGGDLAEWYETKEDVEAGDVVSISADSYEYDSKLGLQKSSILEKASSVEGVVGVVSFAPYQTIGSEVLGKSKHPQAIALAGRVPVKVSGENGSIKAGDLLTVSSIPGVAMRSTKAGVTIGKALEDAECVGGLCSVLTMVNTSYSNGALIKVAYRDDGIFVDNIEGGYNMGRDVSHAILAKMLQEKENITTSTNISEIFTDRVVAGLEVITPTLIADTAEVNRIISVNDDGRIYIGGDPNGTASSSPIIFDSLGNAFFDGQIVAHGFNTGELSNFQDMTIGQLAAVGASITDLNQTSSSTSLTLSSIMESLNAMASSTASTTLKLAFDINDLSTRLLKIETATSTNVDWLLSTSTEGLVIGTPIILSTGLQVDQIASISDYLNLISNTEFIGRPYFNSDTAGFAVMRQGSREVAVVFEKEYLGQPIVNATISFEAASSTATSSVPFGGDGIEEQIFSDDVRFLITNKSEKGFTILLNKPAPMDVPFSWTALAVKSPNIVISTSTPVVIESEVIIIPPSSSSEDTSTTTPEQSLGDVPTSTPDVTLPDEPVVESATSSEPDPTPDSASLSQDESVVATQTP